MVCICCHQKHDYANYDQFASNFDIAYKTIQRVSVPNLNLFGPKKTEFLAKELEDFQLYVMWENELVGTLFPTNMAATI